MSKIKVCMGCFNEWEEEQKACRFCGWSMKDNTSQIGRYKTGDVLGKRYLLGLIYHETEEYVIRRTYDNVIRIPCFLLYQKNSEEREDDFSKDELIAYFSGRFQNLSEEYQREIILLSVKILNNQKMLIFTLKDRYLDVEKFLQILDIDIQEKEAFKDMMEEDEDLQEQKKDSLSDPEKNGRLLPEGTVLEGHYKILRCIGIGGFGITYLANDRYTGRCVAVKEYFPSQWAEREDTYVNVKNSKLLPVFRYGMESFLKEIRITGSLLYTEGTILLQDAFYENDTLYMVMEYISGISIGKELRKREYRPYSTTEVKDIILPVMKSLEEIHEKRLIHSDISPGNIMRNEEGKIFLIDFGASKYQLETQPFLSATFLKTDYASPEQYKTAREGIPKEEGPWTDVYALGASMYYMLTGQKPLDVNSRLSNKKTELMFPKIGKGKVPRRWVKLIQKATELDRKKRFQTMREFQDEMLKLD